MDKPRRRTVRIPSFIVAVTLIVDCGGPAATAIDIAVSLRHAMRTATELVRVAPPPPEANAGNSIGIRG